ncbi:hypothetical protein Psesu_2293 [Pseudoxanthomonas suwonensis 11-1]|uniref:Replicative DNA helicase n=1 Tax=Pseudoxanthomonas suwonensis (strain 11-1) TaxID=743721 RepID=E6WVC8_PSEUU|nr:hypothetical protein [Pseudoxanthomonas suwonensis]ADV28127.1 hypothetical protein Psesu_2293 [Pseudoxanthomonas suwonensis 11-1]
MRVPEDIHARVLELTRAIVDSYASADRKAAWELHAELREFCESTAAAGRDHPFLWETLADFTPDDRAAIELYKRALEQASLHGAATYEGSILLELAERHVTLGESALAYEYAVRADAVASGTDDLDLRRAISQFLLDNSVQDEEKPGSECNFPDAPPGPGAA